MSICSVSECERKHYAKGLCHAHYHRQRLSGKSSNAPVAVVRSHAEILKYYEEVVLTYEGDECLFWPFHRVAGYGRMNKQGVHRLVCEVMYGPAPTPKHHAAHSCGKGYLGCVAKKHLRWATVKENHADKFGHGTLNWGERSPRAKLTAEQIRDIRSRPDCPRQQLATEYGIRKSYVSDIRYRRVWAHLP